VQNLVIVLMPCERT